MTLAEQQARLLAELHRRGHHVEVCLTRGLGDASHWASQVTGEADRLVGASSPAAEAAQIHKTESVDGVMKMREAGPLEIPAMGTLEMKPGGYHIMLMGLKQPLKEGDTLEVTLTFEKAGQVAVKVPVGKVAEGGHDHGSGGVEGSEGSGG